MADTVKILSIDGGGIRGIIPSVILAEIEKRTGKKISDLFDVIAGSSTGGILALGLNVPDDDGKPKYTAADLTYLYESEGHSIFSRSAWKQIKSLGNLIDEKYSDKRIKEIFEKYFGSSMLSQCITDVLITAYEIERRFAWFFKSKRAKVIPDYDFPMKDIVRATTAAPTYFEPHKITFNNSSDYYSLIDGGVYANNPAMCAYVEALTTHKDCKNSLVLSLGTGHQTKRFKHDDVTGWGLAEWAQPILDVVFDGVSDTVDYQLQQLLPNEDNKLSGYFRFQPILEGINNGLDAANSANIRSLKLLAQSFIQEKNHEIDKVCEILLKSGAN